MRFLTTIWLGFLLIAVASSDSTSSEEDNATKIEATTEAILANSTDEKSISDVDILRSTIDGMLGENYRDDLATVKDMTLEEQVLTGRVTEENDEIFEENNQKKSDSNIVQKNDNEDTVNNNPENPIESNINKDFVDVRREETILDENQKNSRPIIQYDDSKTEVTTDPPQKYGQRYRKLRQNVQDSVPLFQLTEGGYENPYKRSRVRDRYVPMPDSSEQSETAQQSSNTQQPERTSSNRSPGVQHFSSQVTYSPSPPSSYAFRQGPLMSSPFDSSTRNLLALNQILPPSTQNEFLNSPTTAFTGYSTTDFQPQFSPSSDVGGIPNFSRDLNNAGAFQTVSNNPFQTPELLFQNSPQIQSQPVLIDTNRNDQTQFQQNPLSTYSGFESMGDSSTPNYASFFRSPAVNVQYQVPSNFYDSVPNSVNPFNSPPINFLSQYPNFAEGAPNQIFQYPDIIRTQNNQQSSNNQRFDPDASQNENKVKIVEQNGGMLVNRDDAAQPPLGTDLQRENIENVYMRYPTVEAGYATEENLPIQNNSEQSKDGGKQSKEEQTNSQNSDPYRNILNSVRNNQRINNSFAFPSDFFRSAPIDFGYQAPQSGVFVQYPGTPRTIPSYQNNNFEPRIPFNSIPSLPDNFLGINNQQRSSLESNETPPCAKENNVSICFEDNNYPKNDILYTINSNPFISDRLLSPELSLNLSTFVERNGNEIGQNENYACDVATKYGMPLRAKNLAGAWRVIINLEGRFTQPVRMEVCKTLGSSCSYTDSRIKTACVQKFSLQRLLTWSSVRGIFSDVYKVPVACSCQITENVEN